MTNNMTPLDTVFNGWAGPNDDVNPRAECTRPGAPCSVTIGNRTLDGFFTFQTGYSPIDVSYTDWLQNSATGACSTTLYWVVLYGDDGSPLPIPAERIYVPENPLHAMLMDGADYDPAAV